MGVAIGHHCGDAFFIHRLFGHTVCHQFCAAEQASAAHIADHLVLFHQRVEVRNRAGPHAQGVVQQVLVLDNPHVLQSRCRSCRATAKGRDVAEIAERIGGIIFEHAKDFFGRHCARNRRIARSHTLSHRHKVRLDAVVLIAKPHACAAHTADHFVDVQQDVVLLADLLNALPIAFRRHDHTAASGHRFQHQAADGIGPFAQDHLFNRVRRALAVVRDIPLLTILQAVRHHHKAVGIGPVLLGAFGLARRGERANRGAVIIALAVEDLVLHPTVVAVRDLAHHLIDLLIGFRARVGIIHTAQPRHLGDQLFGKQSAGNRAVRACKVVHLDQLVGHSLGDAFAAIAHVHCPHRA